MGMKSTAGLLIKITKPGKPEFIRCALRVLCGMFLAIGCASPGAASVQRLAPDLYAYISENDASANATFLVSEKGILVVDTGLNASEGGKLLAEIRKISPAPVRWIVNTHYHPDHRGGNSVVGPQAVIISTAFTRVQAGSSPDYTLNETVSQDLLSVGGHTVWIYHPGPAHTLGDLVVYFPDDRIIATGDLFLTNSCPAMDEGDMENWIHALDQMLALPVERIVPGHFEVAGKKQMQLFRNYLAALRSQLARLHDEGLSLEQVQSRLELSAYKDLRQFPQYEATFKDNAAAYYKQLERRKLQKRQQH
jgi:glyoxylase-like metal-dependent hydrolase (beta-lactamase superfamily II)